MEEPRGDISQVREQVRWSWDRSEHIYCPDHVLTHHASLTFLSVLHCKAGQIRHIHLNIRCRALLIRTHPEW